MSRFIVFGLAVLFVFSSGVCAEDPPADDKGEKSADATAPEVVITATKTETPVGQVGSSITIIDDEWLDRTQVPVVPDALQFIPGMDVRRVGGLGSQTSIFTRGTNSNHTKLLIDGIDIADPSSANNITPIELLLTNGVSRIEALRGPQSSLYGSDAIGGAINILTARGEGPATFYYEQEFGSYSTHIERAGSQFGDDFFNYNVNVAHLESGGFSAKTDNHENDPFRASTVTSRFGVTPTDEFEFNFFLHAIESETEFDSFELFDTNQTDAERIFLKAQPRFFLFDGALTSTFNIAHTYQSRSTFDRDQFTFDPDGPGGQDPLIFPSNNDREFRGRAFDFDWQNDVKLAEQHLVTAGVVYRRETATISAPTSGTILDDGRDIVGVYLQDQIKVTDRITVTPGGRVDHYSDFGTEPTFRVAAAYNHSETDTIVRSSVGTGFKAPAFNQLGGFGANPNLNPERSTGFDFGVEQNLFDKRFTAGATYFYNEIEDLIAFNITDFSTFDGMNVNIENARIQGGEFFIAVRPADNLTGRVVYTYTDSQGGSLSNAGSSLAGNDDGRLLRRPMHKAGFDISYNYWEERGNVTLTVLYVGVRDDVGSAGVQEAEAYTVVNVASSLKICDHVTLLGRVENLFNEEYQDVVGFNSPGQSFFGGFRVEF